MNRASLLTIMREWIILTSDEYDVWLSQQDRSGWERLK